MAKTAMLAIVLFLSGCGGGTPHMSSFCTKAHQQFKNTQGISPVSVQDALLKERVREAHEWCLENPQGMWL